MAEAAVPPVLCFGEILWDCLPRGLFPGGAPIDVAYHLQKLGLTAYPVTAVGADFLGQELIRRLEQWGLDSRFVNVLPDKQTGVVRAHIQPDRRHLAGQADLIKLNDEELEVVTHGLYPRLSLAKAAGEYAAQVDCQRLCVTAGARGAGLLADDKWSWVDGRTVVVKDTVGAGDSFLAALIQGLVGPVSRTPDEILTRACRLGEFVAPSDGATPHYSVAPDGTVYPQ